MRSARNRSSGTPTATRSGMSRKSKHKSRASFKPSPVVRARPTRVAEEEDVIEILDEDVIEILDDTAVSYAKAI